MILHITTHQAWGQAQGEGEYTAPSLASEGFIHCSTIDQVVQTANSFFRGRDGLVLLCMDEKRLTAECRYERPSGAACYDGNRGGLFPHVYGPISLAAVIKAVDFPVSGDGSFSLPVELLK
jgi:uncharacterized protein (DUF952 family)